MLLVVRGVRNRKFAPNGKWRGELSIPAAFLSAVKRRRWNFRAG
jgi:hypothetical protein